MDISVPYLQALQQRPSHQLVVSFLLDNEICPRCCLRFVGIRDGTYALAAPTKAVFVQALSHDHHVGSSKAADTVAGNTQEAPFKSPAVQSAHAQPPTHPQTKLSAAQQHACNSSQHHAVTPSSTGDASKQSFPGKDHIGDTASASAATADTTRDTPTVPADVEAVRPANAHTLSSASVATADGNQDRPTVSADVEAVCPACLGVLQAREGNLQAVPAAMLAGLPEAEGNAGTWLTCTSGSTHALTDCVRQEGHVPTNIGLDITLPAACITRQLALWRHLQTNFSSQGLYSSSQMFQDVVDLKEAVRLTNANPLAQQLGVKAEREGDLHVMLAYLHPASSSETDFLFVNGGGGKGRSYKRKRGQPKVVYAGSRNVRRFVLDNSPGRSASETVMQQAARLSKTYFSQHCSWSPPAAATGVQLAYRVWRKPLYVAGRYLKLLRDVAQSPWIIDGQRKGVSSVEERIADVVLPAFQADRHKFMTAGREDFDVRMLGSGRPFVLEIINARAEVPSPATFQDMQSKLEQEDHGVQVQALQSVPRSICTLLKAGESEKQKSYTAVCQLSVAVTPDMINTINTTKDLVLHQQTPIRVSRRRADLVRHRTVYELSCEPVAGSPRHLILHLRTQAGTYIKEFVHSDEGRTQPHLAALLGLNAPAAILELNVDQIHMNFLHDSVEHA